MARGVGSTFSRRENGEMIEEDEVPRVMMGRPVAPVAARRDSLALEKKTVAQIF
jgi:hypothetical protein